MKNLKNLIVSGGERLRRPFFLILLFALPAIVLTGTRVVADNDIWWHLRAGEWIFEHGAVPRTDHFSGYGAGKPWVAYSWLFELLVYCLYRWFGLMGLAYYKAALTLAITVSLFTLVSRLESRLVIAGGLTMLGLLGMANVLMTPRPWLVTILFFVLELDILLTAKRTGNYRRLWLLPPLFAVWANIHIQFIYGLLLLGLAVSEHFIQLVIRRFSPVELRAIAPARMALVTTACVAATLATPYHFELYAVFDSISEGGFYNLITELHAPDFRFFSNWLLLFAALGAAFAIGWRRHVSPLPLLLFLTGVFISFSARRDVWFLAVVSVVILADTIPLTKTGFRSQSTKVQIAAASLAALVVIGLAFRVKISEVMLERRLSKQFPVAAARAVEERGLTGPLYNHFNWGGYLIWRLRHLPVSMDGRSNIHGFKRAEASLKVWSGQPGWDKDPELTASRVVIAELDMPLTSLLRADPRFELFYEDEIAAVFVARVPGPPHPEQ